MLLCVLKFWHQTVEMSLWLRSCAPQGFFTYLNCVTAVAEAEHKCASSGPGAVDPKALRICPGSLKMEGISPLAQ